jgi:putative flippase GtrA
MCTFLLDYFLYLFFLDHDIGMNIAKAVSSFIAVVFNYIFNSRFNFGGKNKMKSKDLFLYVFLYCFLIAVHVIMNRGLYLVLHEERASVLFAMSVSVFINYACVKRFFSYTKNKNYVI